MQVKVLSVAALVGMVVSMTTPTFSMTVPHCLTFVYEVKASGDTPILEIHTRLTDYMLTGRRIWTSQDFELQENKASITLSVVNGSRDLQYILDFIGIVEEPTSTLIRIANVGFTDGECEQDQIPIPHDEDSGIVVIL